MVDAGAPDAGPARAVVDNPDERRFELLLDGEVVGVVLYRRHGDVVTIPHVEVVPELRGRGYSEPFLDDVLAEIAEAGLRIVPTCSYARSHVLARPHLHHLLAAT